MQPSSNLFGQIQELTDTPGMDGQYIWKSSLQDRDGEFLDSGLQTNAKRAVETKEGRKVRLKCVVNGVRRVSLRSTGQVFKSAVGSLQRLPLKIFIVAVFCLSAHLQRRRSSSNIDDGGPIQRFCKK